MQVNGMIRLLSTLNIINYTELNRFHFGVTLFSR
mgnify:CR=1 FL=1